MDLAAAYASSVPAEVTFSATVISRPSYFFGTHTQCEHETFNAQTAAGPVQIVDNVGLAPAVPVSLGDRIDVRGEMVHDRGRIPIVHWTHHDPQGQHAGGFIRLRGQIYA